MLQQELVSYLNDYLQVSLFNDPSLNGLQVEGFKECTKIATACTASLEAIDAAIEEGVDTLAIVNVTSSTIAREAKYIMPMLAGPEICVATTKGYFSQSYLCSLLMLKYMYKKNIINKDEVDRIGVVEYDGYNKNRFIIKNKWLSKDFFTSSLGYMVYDKDSFENANRNIVSNDIVLCDVCY